MNTNENTKIILPGIEQVKTQYDTIALDKLPEFHAPLVLIKSGRIKRVLREHGINHYPLFREYKFTKDGRKIPICRDVVLDMKDFRAVLPQLKKYIEAQLRDSVVCKIIAERKIIEGEILLHGRGGKRS